MKINRSPILTLILLCLSPLPLIAQSDDPISDEDKDPRIEETIVVTATRSERSVAEVPVSVTVISESEILEAPAMTLDNTLRNVAGLNMRLEGSRAVFPNNNRVSMRGLGLDRALILVDGVPLNDPYIGWVQWNRVPKDTVKQIEVVRGGGSSLFGNYALGGTVNLITKSSRSDAVSFDSSLGSYETANLNAGVTRNVSDKLGLGVWANIFDTAGYDRVPEAMRGLVDTPFASDSISLTSRLDYSGNFQGSVMANYHDNDLNFGTEVSNSSHEILNLSARAGSIIVGNGSLDVGIFYQDQLSANDNTGTASDRNSEFRSNHGDVDVEDLGGSIVWTASFSDRVPLFTVGLDLRDTDGEESRSFFDAAGAVTTTRRAGGTQTSSGFFSQVSWRPSDPLEILVSARLDSWDSKNGSQLTNGELVEFATQSETEFDPRLAIRYQLNDSTQLRGAVYRAFKAPTLNNLYQTVSFGRVDLIANPDLIPETLVGGDVGIDVFTARTSSQINFFYNELDDLVVRVGLSFFPRIVLQPQNVATSRSQGVEVMSKFRMNRHWSFDTSYVWTDSEITDNPLNRALVGAKTPDIPEHFAALQVRYMHDNGITALFRGRAESTRWADANNELKLDAATIFDASISIPLTDQWEVYALGENIFDKKYIVDQTATVRIGPPAQVFAGVRYRSH